VVLVDGGDHLVALVQKVEVVHRHHRALRAHLVVHALLLHAHLRMYIYIHKYIHTYSVYIHA
jgi:hypothetical protein